MEERTERRIILLGKNGSGKSSLGNSLLGRYAFSHGKLSQCKRIGDINERHNITLCIIDTPGLFDADVALAVSALKIQKSLDICPNPHAFLIVVKSKDDTEYLDYTVDMLLLIFGKDVFDNAVIMLTHADTRDVDSWLKENPLSSICGGRVVTAKTLDDCINPSTGDAILNKISLLTCNGESVYSHKSIELHRRVLQCMPVCKRGDDIRSQLNVIKHRASMIQNEIRVIMIGKSGNGKSSTGNSLLGCNGFHVEKSLKAVTEQSNMKTSCLKTTQIISVVDTPGLFDEGSSLAERALEIQRAVEICPEPHAFLLVFNSDNRFTEEEKRTVDMMRIIFGENIFEHTCIVFTRGSGFDNEGKFREFWENEGFLKNVVQKCKGRIFKVENFKQSHASDEAFSTIINSMKTGPVYKNDQLDDHKIVLEEHLNNNQSENQDINKQIEQLLKNLNKRPSSRNWRAGFVVGASAGIVGATVAAGGIGLAAPMLGLEATTAQTSMVGVVFAASLGYLKKLW